MKRLLVLLGFAGLMTASACGDDDDGDKTGNETKDAGFDASKPADDAAARLDSAVAKPVQVENLGEKCKADQDCKGPGASCESTLGEGELSVELKDGYCTAVCGASTECGPNGGCPVVEVTGSIPIQIPGLNISELIPIPSYCLDKCSKSTAGDCRDGYECKSVGELVPAEFKTGIAGAIFLGQAFRTTYCMPPIQIAPPAPVDASVPADASTAIKVEGGLDAGS